MDWTGRNNCQIQGLTPLQDAATNGHLDIVELLVEKNADILLKDHRGMNARLSAAKHAANNRSMTMKTQRSPSSRRPQKTSARRPSWNAYAILSWSMTAMMIPRRVSPS